MTEILEAIDLPKQTKAIHLIVLVHGWMGNALEMDYLKEALRRQIPYDDNSEHFLVHAATCNQGQTNDGIAAGGSRLAAEINTIVGHLQENHVQADITLSLVGNSLGGLYGRYALSEIDWWSGDKQKRQRTLVPRLFVTTCTPHLGVSQHTYIPIPRSLEYLIAQVMRGTGQDLFRFNPIIDEMTYDTKFVAPLLQFDQRIAYINIYGTDFQVPTPTAAFWADTGSPHNIVSPDQGNRAITKTPSNIVMQLETPQRSHEELLFEDNDKKKNEDSIDALSQKLDGLGWTKVLVDVREYLPTISTGRRSKLKDPLLMEKETWTAAELLSAFGGMRQGLFTLAPLGHTVLVANAKDSLNRWITRGGKPIMDHLASTMIVTIQTSQRESSTTP